MTKVYFDPGHGGSDPGAVGHGLKEKDLVLKIAKYARTYLQNNHKGVSVKMSRTTDKFLSLTQRANDANSWGADVFVSFHTNAHTASAKGYEDFVFNGSISSKTASLQNAVHKEVSALFDTNRGKKKANFAVLRQSNMPAVLTESGFITHKSDANYLSKDSNLKKIGEAHAKGIAVFLGLAKGSSAPAKPTPDKPKPTPSKPAPSKPTLKPSGNLGLVDWMKAKKMDSSYGNREKLYGNGYKGTGPQNTALLKKLQNKPASKPVVKPKPKPAAKKNTVTLPKSAKTWRTYKTNVQPIKANSDWSLTPSTFGGITYEILGRPYANVVTVNTSRGKRNIFVGPGTGAVIK